MTRLRRLIQGFAIFGIVFVAPLMALEFWTRTKLFDHVSYTNSVTFDRTWKALKEDRAWNVMYIGNSEVRWGFSTGAFDGRFAEAGLPAYSLNFAIDGLNFSRSIRMFQRLDLQDRLPNLKVAVIGVQLTDAHAPYHGDGADKIDCGSDLMRPLFHSPWAKDQKFDALCEDFKAPNPALQFLESNLATVRYRAQLREAALSGLEKSSLVIRSGSSAMPMTGTGYHPHYPITFVRANYEDGLRRLYEDKAKDPKDYEPMNPSVWPRLVEQGEIFDQWAELFEKIGVTPVFVALPTNPERINVADRAADYRRNSAFMSEWAARTGRIYVDLGMPEDKDIDILYSDHRHLSFIGAARFTSRLASVLAQDSRVRSALAINGVDALTGQRDLRKPVILFKPGTVGEFLSIKRNSVKPIKTENGGIAGAVLRSRSSNLTPSGDGDGIVLKIADETRAALTGHSAVLRIVARQAAWRGSPTMRVMYSRPGVGAQGWIEIPVAPDYASHEVSLKGFPLMEGARAEDLIVFWADPTGSNRGVEIKEVTLQIAERAAATE